MKFTKSSLVLILGVTLAPVVACGDDNNLGDDSYVHSQYPDGEPPDDSRFSIVWETLQITGCGNGGNTAGGPSLLASYGVWTSVQNGSGATFDVGVTDLRMRVNAPGRSEHTESLSFIPPDPEFETVEDGEFGSQEIVFDPNQTYHPIAPSVCDYCVADATIELEGAFVVDGMSIGWYSNDWDATLYCDQ